MSTTEPEPPVGAKRTGRTGSVWTRFPEGWWAMPRAENAPRVALSWEQVQDRLGPLREPRPGDIDRNPEPTPEPLPTVTDHNGRVWAEVAPDRWRLVDPYRKTLDRVRDLYGGATAPDGRTHTDADGDEWALLPDGWAVTEPGERPLVDIPRRQPSEPTPEEKYPEFCNLLGLNNRNMHTEETRITSETGAAKGEKLARYDQIPTWPLFQLAVKYGKGNAKYPSVDGVDNWRKGYEFSKSYAALQRHANLFWSGEDIDPESGDHHLTAVIWHAMAMLEWQSHPELAEKYDDRQDKRDA